MQEPDEALRLCVVLWPFWMRRIDLHEASRRFKEALAAAPERSAVHAEALLAAAAIEFRSGMLPRGMALAEESRAVALEIEDARAEWRALQFLGELGVASDAVEVAVPWIERALELAGREGFAAGEAIGIYSLGVAHWILGDLTGAEELVAQSIEIFRALAGSPERIPSPVNIAEITSELEGRPGLRLVFEDTLQPFVEISCDAAVSYALANQAAIARERGHLHAHWSCSTKARHASRPQTTSRATRRCSSGVDTSSLSRGRRPRRAATSRARSRCGAG
jgi:hypothetical protein